MKGKPFGENVECDVERDDDLVLVRSLVSMAEYMAMDALGAEDEALGDDLDVIMTGLLRNLYRVGVSLGIEVDWNE